MALKFCTLRLDPELHHKIKLRACEEKKSLNHMFIEMIEEKLKTKLEIATEINSEMDCK